MKKTSLCLALFLLAACSSTFAGFLNIVNLTPCTFEFYSGYGSIPNPASPGTPYTFGFNGIIVPQGTSYYADPSYLPQLSTDAPQNLWSTGCVVSSKVLGPGPGYNAFFISKNAPNTFFVSTNTPTCNGGNNFTMNWNQSGNNCDAVILIF
ncbi:hypothetical protein [Taibaiella chishuiensis]|uniref:Uncharacterized protein n=1 Tax=Taibaiella chishuiensis TaxID=1434707 RepID=A0A2P8D0R8_9BACT|nr:hypothetical protein [Taibaiella chishuiensis]PSK90756.1 hypothetical protein B0I18_107167 [Taibaiella chishuiensis]